MPNGGLKKRTNMWLRDSHCYWCGITTVLNRGDNHELAEFATIDHLYHQGHKLREEYPGMRVLACYRCNQDRNEIWFFVYDRENAQKHKPLPRKIPKRTGREGPRQIIREMHKHLEPKEIDHIIKRYYANARRRNRIRRSIAVLEKLIPYSKTWKSTQEYVHQLFRLLQVLEKDLSKTLTKKRVIK